MSGVVAVAVPSSRQRAFSPTDALRLAVVVVQVALALLVVRVFQLESRTFFGVALLAGVGFVPHALLPHAWRLPAFALLSVAGLVLVVGAMDALWLIGAGVALVGICHLPIRLILRVGFLVAAGVALAAARMGALPVPWSGGVWAVFGAIFMFRLALYLHAVQYEPVRPTPVQAAAYFLMVPNPVFPLFPVVDFTTFVRTHYASDAVETYQTGAAWIARGLLHLLLYRIVYQHLPADPLSLPSLSMFVWYLLGTFLLYLRVSGQFHLIVGMLHLYGFGLPETHKLFFLSSSFTDFWRRINIYWKDFMMKLVYYPSFFRLRRWGGTVALVGSTIIVFVVTWLLHSYQWFWILGSFPLTIPDLLFWGILGGLVVVAALREARRGRDRSLGAKRWSLRLAWRVVVTFTTITILWSLWSAESVIEWLWTWRAAARVDAAGVVLIAALLLVGVAIAGRNWSAPQLQRGPTPWWRRQELKTTLTLLTLLALAQPAVVQRLGPAAPIVASARTNTINSADAAVEQRGYYERLDHAPRLGAQAWETQSARPADWIPLPRTEAYRNRDDFRLFELQANSRITFLGQPLSTNEWKMRDGPRTLTKPENTMRFAVLGPSSVFGSGVADGEPFTAQLERRLNEDLGAAANRRYEVLNFGVPAYSILQELVTLKDEALRFAPDVVVITGHTNLAERTASHLTQVMDEGLPVPYPGLDSLLHRWRVAARLPYGEMRGVMRIIADDVHAWVLRDIAAECRRRGIVPVYLRLDMVRPPTADHAPTMRAAADAGFIVLDLLDVYGPEEEHAGLRLAEWDKHPNAAGHARIADRLLAELRRRPELLEPTRGTALVSATAPTTRSTAP